MKATKKLPKQSLYMSRLEDGISEYKTGELPTDHEDQV
jgi:hypothetical protein